MDEPDVRVKVARTGSGRLLALEDAEVRREEDVHESMAFLRLPIGR